MTALYIVGDVFAKVVELRRRRIRVALALCSPPFLALRSYLPDGHPLKGSEIGSEATPAAFIDVMLALVAELAHVLEPWGSIAMELGDTFSGSGGAGGDYDPDGLRAGQNAFDGSGRRGRNRVADDGRPTTGPNRGSGNGIPRPGVKTVAATGAGWPEAKSLAGIPEAFMLSLAYGYNVLDRAGPDSPAGRWRVRNFKPWIRSNPPVGCVDDHTEALTPDGWRHHDDLSDGDLIAAYDAVTDSCRFMPAKFVRWHRDGEPMVAIDKRKTSQRLTMDHRCLVRTRKRRTPFVVLAADLTNEQQVLLSAPLEDVATPPPVTRERAELLGWFVAEGTPHHRQARIRQSASANQAKVERIRALLVADGADFRETSYQAAAGGVLVTFHVKGELAEWLNLHHKRLPMHYATTWPLETVKALYDGLIDGDGHRRAPGGVLFHQKERQVVDVVQVIALRLGLRCSVTYQPTLGASRGGGGAWQATIGQGSEAQRWTKIRKWDGVGIPRETYTGTVWCPQVETTFWLARRDGRTFVTGNSLSDKERPATSYITVATRAAARYFDLDAVRTPHAAHGGPQGGISALDGGSRLGQRFTDRTEHAAGAPPRDWVHTVDMVLDACLDDMAGKRNGNPRAAAGTARANTQPNGQRGGNWDTLDVADTPSTVGARGVHLRRALERAGILTTVDAIDRSPKGYKGAHYAVWPAELVKQLVLEMAPRRVCTTCGQPSRRLTSVDYTDAPGGSPMANPTNKKFASTSNKGQGLTARALKQVTTLGWSDCGCPGGEQRWQPGRVLDPFVGSGTTLQVCTGLGRDSIGIDLDYTNVGLAMERVGMWLAVEWPEPDLSLPALGPGSPNRSSYDRWARLTGDVWHVWGTDDEPAAQSVRLAGDDDQPLPTAKPSKRRAVPVSAGQSALF
jgi:hypothetical protein